MCTYICIYIYMYTSDVYHIIRSDTNTEPILVYTVYIIYISYMYDT